MTTPVKPYDVVVIGGGIVGLAVAHRALSVNPTWKVAVVEKEASVAFHQTGHNSGVMHSGIYYAPGSLKARTCREGRLALEAFCAREGLPYRRCGKLIVAVEPADLPRLDALYERGRANGVDCEQVDVARMKELEPFAGGIAGLHVKDTGVTDFLAVSTRLAERITQGGGEVRLGAPVTALERKGELTVVHTAPGPLWARRVVNCAGLHSDRVARMTGAPPEVRIVPFRGEYRLLTDEAAKKVRALIYPVPDPRFPFLGVHFTRTVHGQVKAGPSAVLAFAREGYRPRDVVLRDVWEALGFAGTRRAFRHHVKMGLGELFRARSSRRFVSDAQRLLPSLTEADLLPGPTGVRAQAVSRDGALLDDFALKADGTVLHVLNAPSPAATAALAIGDQVVAQLR